MATTSPVWFITGCSSGFGREVAKQIIAKGWPVVVTARNKAQVEDLTGENVLALVLDVTDQPQIDAAVAATKERFGRIDVLVNNAGYGYMSSIEEGDESEIRAQFDANVFGLFAMTRAVLPLMRAQRRGHVINITSVAGHIGNPSAGYYAASKHAVEGFSKSLSAEGGPIGVKVTSVAPGPFRTDWAGRSLRNTPSKIAEYDETAAARQRSLAALSGKQAGDPVRAATAMIELTEAENPPLHIVFGAQGVGLVTKYHQRTLDEVEAWKEVGLDTDFPD